MNTILCMSPVGESRNLKYHMANRSENNKVLNLGILNNQKVNAGEVLDELARILEKKHNIQINVRHKKLIQSIASPKEIINDFAQKCDAVIIGVGD